MVPEISNATDRFFFVILDHFLRFYLLTTLKNQIFEKMKKLPGDIIIFHMCNLNDNHMVNDSWDMEHDGQNLLPLWTIFCPFTPTPLLQKKTKKKHKKSKF